MLKITEFPIDNSVDFAEKDRKIRAKMKREYNMRHFVDSPLLLKEIDATAYRGRSWIFYEYSEMKSLKK